MNNLSSNSLIKLFSCLKLNNQFDSVDRLRQTCITFNSFAKENEFDKVDAKEIRIHMHTDRNRNTKELIVMMRTKSNIVRRIHLQHVFSKPDLTYEGRYYGYDSIIQKRVIAANNAHNIEELIVRLLTNTLKKVNKIEQFSIFCLHFNDKLIESLKKLKNSIRCARTLNIQDCKISSSEEEMTDFLDIFDNIRSLCVTGKFKEACLVDKHLFEITDQINIFHGLELDPRNRNRQKPFTGLTSALCDYWRENKNPRSVIFKNIATKIPFDAVGRLFSSVSKLKIEPAFLNDGKFKFGLVKIEPTFVGDMVKVQRKRKLKWTINEETKRVNKYTVSWPNSSSIIEFQATLPYVKPHFAMFLETLQGIRTQVAAATSFTGAEESDFQRSTAGMERQLYEYEIRYKLADPKVNLAGLKARERRLRGFDEVYHHVGQLRELFRNLQAEAGMFLNHHVDEMQDAFRVHRDVDGADRIRTDIMRNVTRLEQITRLRISQPAPVEPMETE